MERGRSVGAVEDKESCFMCSERVPPSLFVDVDIVLDYNRAGQIPKDMTSILPWIVAAVAASVAPYSGNTILIVEKKGSG